MEGLLNSSTEAVKKSASAKSLKKVKERGAKDAPTEPKHLTNKCVRRMEHSAGKAVLRFANDVNLPSQGDNKENLVTQTSITIKRLQSPPKVGGSKSSAAGKRLHSRPSILVTSTDPDGLGKAQQIAMYENGLLDHVVERMRRDIANKTVPFFARTPDNVTMITSMEHFDLYKAEEKANRARANKSQTQYDIEIALKGKVKTHKRSSW